MPLQSDLKENVGSFFLDSGAHSLFNLHTIKKGKQDFSYYETDAFWDYVNEYAAFLKKYRKAIDWYVNVDVIHNPKLSWKVLKYLEDTHKLHPLPVIHVGTSTDWLKKHLDHGYDYIGFGGLGQTDLKRDYYSWANDMFKVICPKSNNYEPIIKTHGFAMTSYDLLVKYPWASVDSASWAKAGAYGTIYVPRNTKGKHDFLKRPYSISVSLTESKRKKDKKPQANNGDSFDLVESAYYASNPAAYKRGKHLFTLSKEERRIVETWLNEIGVELGSVDKEGNAVDWGVVSHYQARKIANLKFFTAVQNYLTSLEPRKFNARASHATRQGLLY